MDKKNEKMMEKRIKSFLWRVAMVGLAAIIDFLLNSLMNVEIPNQYVVLAGLVLGEISKWLNNKYKYKNNGGNTENPHPLP